MTHEYVTFEKFNTKESAQELAFLLNDHGIEYQIEDSSSSLDSSFATGFKEFRLKLKSEDFEKADNLLQKISTEQFDDLPEDYYLLSFSNGELLDLIAAKDEWSPFDFVLAQKLLQERGQEVTVDELKKIKAERIAYLRQPEKNQTYWIFFGYVLAFAGGILGIFLGWYLKTHKKTLPNGEEVYAYSESNRKSGQSIFATGTVFFIFWIVIRIVLWG